MTPRFLWLVVLWVVFSGCPRVVLPVLSTSDEPECTFNSDCAEPLVCAANRCRAPCATARDCPADQRCAPSGQRGSNVCVPPESTALCALNSDCPEPWVCHSGTCRASCAVDADCSLTGGTCSSGVCSQSVTVDTTAKAKIAGLRVVSGNNQSAVVGTPLAQPLVVMVVDETGAPVPGVSVVFEVVAGGGAVSANTVVTRGNGTAEVFWTVGILAGEQTGQLVATTGTAPAWSAAFVASTIPGPAAGLAFSREPILAYAGTPVANPWEVQAVDAYGNHASSAETVTMSVHTGTGTLSGNLVRPMVDGAVEFSGVSYSTPESGVEVRASSGAWSVLSQPMGVAAAPPGACIQQDAFFRTDGGGCMDLQSGMVWSALSPKISWSWVIWDSVLTDAPPDEHDQGRTNDYPPVTTPCERECDLSSVAYCHSLTEGGQLDWRVPTPAELMELFQHEDAAPAPSYLVQLGDDALWSSENTGEMATTLARGIPEQTAKTSPLPVRCVRGDHAGVPRIVVVDPGYVTVGAAPRRLPMRVAIVTEDGRQVNAERVTLQMEVAAGGAFTLGGTTTVQTQATGTAVLNGFTLAPAGTVTLRVRVVDPPGGVDIMPAEVTLNVGPFEHTCKMEGAFVTAAGGCQHVRTGLVVSTPSESPMSWDQAIWDATSPTGNAPQDEHDGTRTHDYEGDPPTLRDASLINYCHDLVEGGFSDWRMPTLDELLAVVDFGQGLVLHSPFPMDQVWSSRMNALASAAVHVDVGDGIQRDLGRALERTVVCVRRPP